METTRTATLMRIAREALAKRANTADEGADSGFTLIELMVVLLILAILLAIAIPTFLGVTTNAHDRAAQSNLTNALTTAKANFVSGQSYQDTAAGEVASLNSAEPSLTFTDAASTDQNTISVGVYQQAYGTAGSPWDVIILAAYSNPTGHCWWASDVENPAATTGYPITNLSAGTKYDETTSSPANSADCNANAIATIANPPHLDKNGYPTQANQA